MEAEYVPEQPESVGEVRQLLTVVISVVSVVQVELGQVADNSFGMVLAALE